MAYCSTSITFLLNLWTFVDELVQLNNSSHEMQLQSHGLKLSDLRLWPMLAVQFLGAFNDNVFKNLFILLLTYKSIVLLGISHHYLIPLAQGVFILSFLFFSGIAGDVCEKYEKSKLIKLMKALELLIMIFASIGLVYELYTFLFICLFLMGLQSTFFGPLKYSYYPYFYKGLSLFKSNAWLVSTTNLAILLGTNLGGILTIGTENQETLSNVLITSSLLSISILGLLISLLTKNTKHRVQDLKINFNPISSSIKILKNSFKLRGIKRSLFCISWFWFLGAVILNLLPIIVKESLLSDQTVFTFIFTIFSIGVFLGPLIYQKFAREFINYSIIPFALIFMSLSLYMIGLTIIDLGQSISTKSANNQLLDIGQFLSIPGAWKFVAGLMVFAMFGGIYQVPLYTTLQNYSGRENNARVVASNNILNALFILIASFFCICLFKINLSSEKILMITALVNLVWAAVMFYLYRDWTIKFTINFFCNFLYRVEVHGIENIKQNDRVLLTSNHVSYIDWLVLSKAIPFPMRFIIDDYYYQKPLFKWFLSFGRTIPISTAFEDKGKLIKAFKECEKAFDQNDNIALFPEGTLSVDGKLGSIQKGISRIVKKSNPLVLPISINRLYPTSFSRYPRKGLFIKFRLWPRKVFVNIGKMIPAEEFTVEKLSTTLIQLTADFKYPSDNPDFKN